MNIRTVAIAHSQCCPSSQRRPTFVLVSYLGGHEGRMGPSALSVDLANFWQQISITKPHTTVEMASDPVRLEHEDDMTGHLVAVIASQRRQRGQPPLSSHFGPGWRVSDIPLYNKIGLPILTPFRSIPPPPNPFLQTMARSSSS